MKKFVYISLFILLFAVFGKGFGQITEKNSPKSGTITFYFKGPSWMDNDPHDPEVWGPFTSGTWEKYTFTNISGSDWWTVDVTVTDPSAEITYQVRFAEAGTTKYQKSTDDINSDPTYTTTTNQIWVDASDGNFNSWNGNDFNLVSGAITEKCPTPETVSDNNFSNTATWLGGIVPSAGKAIIIKNTVTLDQNYSASSVTINSGAELAFNSTETLTIEADGTLKNNGTFTRGSGTVKFQGSASTSGTSTTTMNNVTISGTGVSIDNSITQVAGKLTITTGSLSNAPEFLSGSTLRYEQGGYYERVTEWNDPYHVEIANSTDLDLNIDAFGGDLTVLGNLTIESESSADMASTTDKLIINGNLILDGELILGDDIGGDLTINGNWTRTGTFTPNDRLVLFNGTSTLTGQTTFDYITVASGASLTMSDGITANTAFVVQSTATLDMGTDIIDGGGSFTLNSGATLKIGHLSGISSTAATGNVQVTGTRTFANDATYHYTGNGNQYSGDELPTTSAAKTIIIETANSTDEFRINTGSSVGIAAGGKLKIISGKLIEADAVSNGRHVDGAGDLEMTGGTYFFERDMATNVPRLTGTYSLTGGQIVLGAAGDQELQGGETYYDLVFEGSGTATTSSSITDVNSVTISDTKIVDVESSALGGAGTDLTMTGGTLRISKVSGTQPTMEGSYTLSGGTIEFYGTSDTQNQTIRSGVSYNNVTINAAAANLTDGNVSIFGGENITVAGTITVNSPACLKLGTTSSSYVAGGTFELQSGAALLFGNDITTGTATGNIRTTTKTLAEGATYILYGGTNQTIEAPFPAVASSLIDEKTGGNFYLNQDLEISGTLNLDGGIIDASGHTITVSNEATTAISGESSSSYIVGTLVRGIAAAKKDSKGEVYNFPIGTATSYNPVTVDFTTSPSGAGTLEAEFSTTLPAEYENGLPISDGTQTIDHLADGGYWTLTPTSLAGYTYDLTIQGSDFVSMDPDFEINDASGLRLLIRDDFSNPWQFLGSHGTGAASPPSVSRTGISQFGVVAMGAKLSENVLPVELLDFNAHEETESINLKWSTATETNNDFFTLFHSSDGINFEPIKNIEGASNSTQTRNYNYVHNNPSPGINYYYLKQTDFDGTTSQSRVISINFTGEHNWYFYSKQQTLYIIPPNIPSQKITYRIFNLNGQLIQSGTYNYNQGERIYFKMPGSAIIIKLITAQGTQISKKIIKYN